MEALKEKAALLKSIAEEISAMKDTEPFVKSNLESILAHVNLLCIELGLDIEE